MKQQNEGQPNTTVLRFLQETFSGGTLGVTSPISSQTLLRAMHLGPINTVADFSLAQRFLCPLQADHSSVEAPSVSLRSSIQIAAFIQAFHRVGQEVQVRRRDPIRESFVAGLGEAIVAHVALAEQVFPVELALAMNALVYLGDRLKQEHVDTVSVATQALSAHDYQRVSGVRTNSLLPLAVALYRTS